MKKVLEGFVTWNWWQSWLRTRSEEHEWDGWIWDRYDDWKVLHGFQLVKVKSVAGVSIGEVGQIESRSKMVIGSKVLAGRCLDRGNGRWGCWGFKWGALCCYCWSGSRGLSGVGGPRVGELDVQWIPTTGTNLLMNLLMIWCGWSWDINNDVAIMMMWCSWWGWGCCYCWWEILICSIFFVLFSFF